MKTWTPENIALLGTMTDAALGKILGITQVAVQKKRFRMGIQKKGRTSGVIPSRINGKVNPEYTKARRNTPEGRAVLKAYNQSDKGKAARKRYEQSEKYKATRKRRHRRIITDPDKYADYIINTMPKNTIWT